MRFYKVLILIYSSSKLCMNHKVEIDDMACVSIFQHTHTHTRARRGGHIEKYPSENKLHFTFDAAAPAVAERRPTRETCVRRTIRKLCGFLCVRRATWCASSVRTTRAQCHARYGCAHANSSTTYHALQLAA